MRSFFGKRARQISFWRIPRGRPRTSRYRPCAQESLERKRERTRARICVYIGLPRDISVELKERERERERELGIFALIMGLLISAIEKLALFDFHLELKVNFVIIK